MTDDELIKGIKNKDEEALDFFIRQYGGLIKSIISYHICNNYRDECINDVLLSVWNNISRFNPKKNSLKNWIGAICKYKCIDYKRKYYKEVFLELNENFPSSYTAESNILQKEIDSEINELLSCLKDDDKEIFKRRYIDCQTVNEISGIMKISPSILYNRLSRGRKKLRKKFIGGGCNEK